MSSDTSLQFFQRAPSTASGQSLSADAGILGMSSLQQPASALPWPVQQVRMSLLSGTAKQLHEYWHSTAPCRRGRSQDIHFKLNLVSLNRQQPSMCHEEITLYRGANRFYPQVG